MAETRKALPKSARSTALLVLGMHRSGTSALAGALAQTGIALGRHLYGPQSGVNDRGFWEHADIAETHDAVFRRLGSYWDDFLPLPEEWWNDPRLVPVRCRLAHFIERDFRKKPLWALKDPRLCRLLPLWTPILHDLTSRVVFVITVRHPQEVAASLARRDGFSWDKSLLLWMAHNLDAFEHSIGYPRITVDFAQLVSEPAATMQRIQDELGLRYPSADWEAKIGCFLDAGLRHKQTTGKVDADPELVAFSQRMFETITTAGPALRAQVNPLEEFREPIRRFVTSRTAVLLEQLRDVYATRGEYEQLFFEAYRSIWWKIAWPLRHVERWVRYGRFRCR